MHGNNLVFPCLAQSLQVALVLQQCSHTWPWQAQGSLPPPMSQLPCWLMFQTQFHLPWKARDSPQKLHDASNKTCKVTQHFIIHKSKEPNCQRQAGSSQLAKLPRFQHAGHVASMCLKTPGFAITAYNLLPFVGSIRSTETQCSLICCSMLNSRI